MATFREIASETGLSIATVSRAFQPDGKVSDETRLKVMLAAQNLDKSGRDETVANGMIGLILAGPENHFYDATIRIIDRELRESGYFLVCVISNDSANTKNYMRQLCQQGARAIILVDPSAGCEEALEELLHIKVPVIQVFRKVYPGLDSVVVDDAYGVYMIIKTLLNNNHQRILYVGPQEGVHYEGYLKAYEEAGLEPLHGSETCIVDCKNQSEFIVNAINQLNPTAIFSHTENNSIETLRACQVLNKKISEEISLIAYDDYPWLAMMNISAIFHPLDEIGKNVCRLLKLRLENKNPGNNSHAIHLVATPHLISRDSVRFLK